METDADPQPNIRLSSGNPMTEGEEKIVGAREVKDATRKFIGSTNLSS